MSFFIENAYAQGAAPSQGSPFFMIIMIGIFFVIFYFMLIRPQSKRAKEHRDMLGRLASGDEVVTGSGILGKVIEVGDNFVTVEVADGVRLKVQKSHIGAVMPKGTLKAS